MRKTNRPVEFDLPPTGAIVSYKIIYVLCTTNQEGFLKATHYTICVSGGHEPVWGVWTIGGRFVRFFTRKERVANAYPKLVWRRLYGAWTMVNARDMSNAEKGEELHQLYRQGRVVTGREVEQITPKPPTGENIIHFSNGRKK